ncbi:hypothetical protein BN77_p11595 [Rhizobium mesoamericanum STM3625]|uniref:Uncharacterized protein n=1 Tax=Rhizobium mesoamericanum STM3625 TaxID=1211777 RepID=K0Q5V6_9HYPH|nr:hypothetical protein BN77_p11595 [Rhizobium mesoamericanum STM3625]
MGRSGICRTVVLRVWRYQLDKCGDRYWRILAINVAAVVFGTTYRARSLCEENTRHRPSAKWKRPP